MAASSVAHKKVIDFISGSDSYDRRSRQYSTTGPARNGRSRNRAGNFSVGRLMEFLNRLGQDVRITVKPTRKRVGEMEVVMG